MSRSKVLESVRLPLAIAKESCRCTLLSIDFDTYLLVVQLQRSTLLYYNELWRAEPSVCPGDYDFQFRSFPFRRS